MGKLLPPIIETLSPTDCPNSIYGINYLNLYSRQLSNYATNIIIEKQNRLQYSSSLGELDFG